jgi:PPOX class F420-dependent enzyme/OxyR family protein
VSVFTDAERRFLRSAKRGHIATASPSAVPDVAVVGFSVDEDDAVLVGGRGIEGTIKYANVTRNPMAAFVVDGDDFEPGRGLCGVKVRGPAALVEDAEGRQAIRITATDVWTWGINRPATPGSLSSIDRRKV